MKIEKKLFNASISEIILISLAGLILLNGFAYILFTLVWEVPFEELFQKTWVILIFIPLSQGIIQAFVNRNAVLTIESKNKSKIIQRRVENILVHSGYHEIQKKDNYTIFDHNAKWKRIINFLFRGKVKIASDLDFTRIYGKRIFLSQIETKIKLDKELQNS